MVMEWRLRERSNGGWVAEKGAKVESQPNPCGIGYIMPAFIVYEAHTFDTKRQALNFIKHQ